MTCLPRLAWVALLAWAVAGTAQPQHGSGPGRHAAPQHGATKSPPGGLGAVRGVAAGAGLGGAALPLPAGIEAELRRAAVPLAAVGLLVHEVGAAAPVIAHNTGQAFNPASLMKLVTTLAALDLLGPAYTWKTTLLASPFTGDALADLHLRGTGDPKLVLEHLWLLVRHLRARGVREIRGDLVVDRSAFAVPPHDPARFDGDALRPYNVGPDAALVNFKTFQMRFIPDARGRTVLVASEPALPGVVSAPRLADGECGDWRAGLRADFSDPARPVFAGSYPRSCGERVWPVALMTPNAYLETLFRQLWTEAGGVWRGTVREGPVPSDAVLLVERDSVPLAEIVRDINKFSNNVMARQLYLTLPLVLERPPGTPERAERLVRDWLASRGLAMPELVIENGAGLSRIERISPASLGRLLLAAFASPVMPEFIASLPLAGTDGTMRRRQLARSAAGRAHIKTGTLNDVRAIAGYVQNGSGKRFVVVAIVNHVQAAAAQGAFDSVLQWVAEQP